MGNGGQCPYKTPKERIMNIHPRMESLLREATERNASDLFIAPGEPPIMRLKGEITRLEGDVFSTEDVNEIATSLIGEEDLGQLGTKHGGITRSCSLPGEFNASFGVALSSGSPTITCRIGTSRIWSAEELKVPESIVELSMFPYGLVLVSGKPGSGKTTLLYALIDHINSNKACHITTIEHPIGLQLLPKKALIQQREVGVDIPDIVTGLRTAMYLDPDVIMVGEVKNFAELEACITAAGLGHLVFVQMHSGTPEDAIRDIIDVLPEDHRTAICKRLADVFRGAAAQRLVPKAAGDGRLAVYGVLTPDKEMSQAIAKGEDFMSRKTPMPEGCQTMAEHIEEMLADGMISEETAEKVLADLQ